MPCGDDVTMSMFQLECERAERMRLEHAVKTGSLPDDCKMGVATLGAELAAAKLSYSAGASASRHLVLSTPAIHVCVR